jgi:hypothetical protein
VLPASTVVVLAVLLFGGPNTTGATAPLQGVLERGGFTGALAEGVTVTKIGTIRSGGKLYDIRLHYWIDPHPASTTHHHRRLLVFETQRGRMIYLGHYSIPDVPKRIEGRHVVFDFPSKLGDRIVFGPDGPPAWVVLDGERCWFAR